MGRKGGGGEGGVAVVPGANSVSMNTSFYKLLIRSGCHNTQPFITPAEKSNEPFFFHPRFTIGATRVPGDQLLKEEKLLLPAQKLTADSESNQIESKWARKWWDPPPVHWPAEQLTMMSQFV